jgi:hypothetical protein
MLLFGEKTKKGNPNQCTHEPYGWEDSALDLLLEM